MRWFLGLVLVVALITGALYGVGRFLLPNTLSVTRTVSVERPRVAVYAMINDLRIAKEWSPYYAMDPDAEYAFTGEGPGAGQTMRWISDVRDVGAGRMSIVNSTDNESVESILELRDRAATLNSTMELRPSEDSTLVSWAVTAECAEGSINVPCRYMNLVLRQMVESHLDRGLARLEMLAEQLPNIDFEGYNIVEVPVEPIDVIFVDVSIASTSPTFDDRAVAERDGVNALDGFIASTGGQVTRANTLVRVFPSENGGDGRYRFSVGYPYSGPAPLRLVGVRVGQTPGGAALRVDFEGRRSQIGAMYQRIDAFMQAHRKSIRPGSEAWEIVRGVQAPAPDSPYPNDPIERTEIYYPIE